MSASDRGELRELVAAFRAHLGWIRERGVRAVLAAPSPRRLAPEELAREAAQASAAAEAARPVSPPAGPRPTAAPAAAPPAPAPEQRSEPPLEQLRRIRAELGECQRCGLAQGRTRLVFGAGSPEAELMFIGEAPGHDEDLQGEPFVGAAGQLLSKMIEAMGLRREEVYIANIIKCRPPGNRDPLPEEVARCEPFLREQIAAIAPRIIIAMGNHAAKTLLRTELGITRLRGRFHTYQGVPLRPTFHPAYLLRNAEQKRPAWEDLKAVMAEMDRLGLRRRRAG
jgi:DNA polymerase